MMEKFIKGEASLDSDWATYCKNLERLGLPKLLEAYQSIYDRFN